MKLGTGCIVESKYWDNPVKILNIKKIGSKVQVNIIDIKTGIIQKEILINPENLIIMEVYQPHREYWHWAIESWRIQYYDFNEEQLAPIISNINIEPYQLEAVYEYILRPGSIRYLIAHDPGAGKTIIAGMVLKELEAKELLKKILILVPPGLIAKWQFELASKFSDNNYRRLTKEEWDVKSKELINPWMAYEKIVMSPYFALRKLEHLPETMKWDLVIIDEVHKFNNPKAKIYHNLISTIARKSRHLLLLTATPHDGHQEHFLTIIRYLIPNISLNQNDSETLGTIMMRRTKEELFHADGSPVFLPRKVKSQYLEMKFDESLIYKNLKNFIDQVFSTNKAIHLIKMVYQRRFSSSLAALKETLEKRLEFLREKAFKSNNTNSKQQNEAIDKLEPEEESDILTEDEKRVISLKTEEYLIKFETPKVQDLLDQLHSLDFTSTKKWLNLQSLLNKFPEFKEGPENAKKNKAKLLIFTEFKDTLDWIVKNLKKQGWAVTYIHGGIPMGEIHDINSPSKIPTFNNQAPKNRLISMFWFKREANIMVGTDAAGEGIDLEFCNYLINWDLPWNPMRLEQRMGRIHRYGQMKTSYIYNFILSNTVEGRVQQIIMSKLDQIREDFEKTEKGSGDRVFDVISGIIKEKEFGSVLSALEEKSEVEKETYLNQFGEDIKKRVEKFLKEADLKIHSKPLRDCLGLRSERNNGETALERFKMARRETPEYLRDFFLAAWKILGGLIEKNPKFENAKNDLKQEIYKLEHPESKLFGKQQSFPIFVVFKNLKQENPSIQVLQRGNPLFDGVVQHFRKLYADILEEGAILIDPKSEIPYLLYFYLVSYKNRIGEPILKKIILLKIIPKDDVISLEFFTRNHLGLTIADEEVFDASSKYWIHYDKQKKIEKWLVNTGLSQIIKPVKDELRTIYKPYIQQLKVSLDEYFRDFNRRSRTLPKEIRTKEYEELLSREKEINQQIRDYEANLEIFPKMPKLISRALIIPGYEAEEGIIKAVDNFREILDGGLIISNSSSCLLKPGEIDRRGIERVMLYEKNRGRIPVLVDDRRGLGYDIESYLHGKIVRKIEVKSHNDSGGFTLQRYEKNHAEREPETSWIYIVDNCASDIVNEREIYQIRDIIGKFEFEAQEYTNIRYPISQGEWKKIIEEEIT